MDETAIADCEQLESMNETPIAGFQFHPRSHTLLKSVCRHFVNCSNVCTGDDSDDDDVGESARHCLNKLRREPITTSTPYHEAMKTSNGEELMQQTSSFEILGCSKSNRPFEISLKYRARH
jgi:hypothetical protein